MKRIATHVVDSLHMALAGAYDDFVFCSWVMSCRGGICFIHHHNLDTTQSLCLRATYAESYIFIPRLLRGIDLLCYGVRKL